MTPVKLIFLARRRPELSAEEFQDYWENKHAALVREVQPIVKIRSYVQSYTLDTELTAGFCAARGIPVETPPDGVAEVEWDSLDDVRAAFSGPDGEEAARRLVEDEGRFVDFSTSRAFWTSARRII